MPRSYTSTACGSRRAASRSISRKTSSLNSQNAPLAAELDDRLQLRARDNLAGRVVRKIDDDHARVGTKSGMQAVEIQRPATLRLEWDSGDLANTERHRFGGLVVGRDHDGVILRTEQHPHSRVNGLFRARETQDVIRRTRVVRGGNLLSERRCTPRLGIRETERVERVAVLGARELQQRTQAQGLGIRSCQIELGDEFPLREVDLQVEIPHRLRHHFSPVVCRSPILYHFVATRNSEIVTCDGATVRRRVPFAAPPGATGPTCLSGLGVRAAGFEPTTFGSGGDDCTRDQRGISRQSIRPSRRRMSHSMMRRVRSSTMNVSMRNGSTKWTVQRCDAPSSRVTRIVSRSKPGS